MTRIPEEIIYTYVAFLNNYDKVAAAIEKYYTDLTGQTRAKLLQEVARPQAGTMSERILKANKVVDKVLDLYNSTQPLEHDEVEVDIDISDDMIEGFVVRSGIGLMTPVSTGLIKRV